MLGGHQKADRSRQVPRTIWSACWVRPPRVGDPGKPQPPHAKWPSPEALPGVLPGLPQRGLGGQLATPGDCPRAKPSVKAVSRSPEQPLDPHPAASLLLAAVSGPLMVGRPQAMFMRFAATAADAPTDLQLQRGSTRTRRLAGELRPAEGPSADWLPTPHTTLLLQHDVRRTGSVPGLVGAGGARPTTRPPATGAADRARTDCRPSQAVGRAPPPALEICLPAEAAGHSSSGDSDGRWQRGRYLDHPDRVCYHDRYRHPCTHRLG